MAKISEQELEEIKYTNWVLLKGPERETEKHKALAEKSLKYDIEANGWKVLSVEQIKPLFEDISITEAVIRKKDVVKVIFWHTFNKGWMQKGAHGSSIFNPYKD